MNTRKFNFELMEMDLDSIMKMVNQVDDPLNMPTEQTTFYMVKVVSNRKKANNKPNVYDKEIFIKTVCETVPKESLNHLEKLAKKQDSNALLKLADCYFFGLKGLEPNRTKAKGYYQTCANLGNQEAMTMMAYCCYTELLKRVDLTDDPALEFPTCQVPTPYLSITQPIPNVLVKTNVFKHLLNEMWDHLEKCVDLNWVSHFLIQQASDVQSIRYEEERLRPSIKRELIKYNVQQYQETQQKFAYSCGNPFCTFKFDSESSLLACQKCKRIKYCSTSCQLSHRDKHKDTCVKCNQSEESSPDKQAPTKSLFTMNGKNNETLIFETKSVSLNGFKFFQHQLNPKEALGIILAKTRLASIQNGSLSEKELEQEIDKLTNRGSYPSAIKFINLAIDKLRLKNPISVHKNDHVKFIQLYYKRVQCFLKIGELRRAPRYKQLALDDCVLILESGIFEKINCDALKSLELIKIQLENEQISESSVPNRHRRRPRHRNKQDQIKKEFSELSVTTCSKLIQNKMAVNSQIDMDFCPICSTEWQKFVEPCLAVILPCQHAFCARCVLNYGTACKQSKIEHDEEDVPNDSCCSLCRNEFSPMYLDEICQKVCRDRIVESLFKQLDKLPLDVDEAQQLVSNLLVRYEFDVNRLEGVLFDMVGMVQAEKNRNLDYEQKQEYFELARAPVRKLTKDYDELRQQVELVYDSSSSEWHEKFRDLEDVKNRLNLARQNAAHDIYERMNSAESMGTLSNDKTLVQVDFHGLYAKEAIEKFEELVEPILAALGKIKLITGYGLHNKSGESILKNKVKEYLKMKNIKFSDVNGNEGAILIYKN